MTDKGRLAEAKPKAYAGEDRRRWMMGDRTVSRVMTSLTGSFMGSPAAFLVDVYPHQYVELHELFNSDHFLSAVAQVVLEAYPESGDLALQFVHSVGKGWRRAIRDETVGVFVFCKQTRKLIGTVGINALRRTARAFLASPAARM
jgi:hypothetical protein